MSVRIVPWSTGDIADICAMIDAAVSGEIDLQQDGGWSIGDRRTITVNNFIGRPNSAASRKEDIDIVITSFDEYMGCGNVLQFDFVRGLYSEQPMCLNGATVGGYGSTNMYTMTLPAMVEALPVWIKNRLKTFSVLTHIRGDATQTELIPNNKLALRSKTEVYGENQDEASEGALIPYYQTEENRAKLRPSVGAGKYGGWWLRTPGHDTSTRHDFIQSDVYASDLTVPNAHAVSNDAYWAAGVSPFGCLGTSSVLNDGIPIDEDHFPDPVFRQYISSKFDEDGSGFLTDDEISKATELKISINTVSGTGLTSIEGINYLTALKVLSISDIGEGSRLSQVDISSLLDLEELTIRNSAISTVDISHNAKLRRVSLTYDPNLSSIDFSNNPNIVTLGIGPGYTFSENCNITQIDLSNLRELITLDMKGVKISECDLTNNYALSSLIIYGPNLQSLKINKCYGLHYLSCVNNPNLIKLDISGNPYLIDAYTNYSPSIISYGYVARAYRYTTGVRDDGTAGTLEVDLNTNVVIDAIAIISQPQDTTVKEGLTFSFCVEAEGQDLTYQWQYRANENGLWLTDANNVTSTYEDLAAMAKNGYQYRCLISNQSASIYSRISTLTVIGVPTIISQPQSRTAIEGQTVTFSVAADGNELSYKWQSSLDNGSTWTDISNSNSSDLIILTSLALNNCRYRCVVTNEAGELISDSAILTVTADTSVTKPTITSHPSSITVAEGSNATFAVSADGSDISYQWQVFKNNQWQSITGETNSSYVISATRGLDKSKYRCVVSNAAGAVYSNEATLTVSSGVYVSTPTILTHPKSVNVDLGEVVTFWIRADGGGLTYQWQKFNNGNWYDITGAIGNTYTLTARTEIHNTRYRCVVTNTAGSVYSNSATLSIRAGQDLSFYGYHSIIISGKNTYGEWEMYPTSRPHVAPPEVKTSYVDLPGADGGLDYTDLLTGEPRYGYRKGSWEFLLIPQDKWASVYRSLVNFLHGRQHTVILEDDPDYVYTGRLSVNEWQSAAHNSLITIDYILEPHARNISGEEEDAREAEILDAANELLSKAANAGMVIAKVAGGAALVDPSMLFEDGDNIAY